MNKKQNGMKIIAFFLAIVLGVTIVPVLPVHVQAEDQVVSDVALQAKREAEKIAETVKDEKSSEPAGDWKQVKKDGLARNAFHNEVQKYIEENYSKTEKEKQLKIKKKGKDEKEVERE